MSLLLQIQSDNQDSSDAQSAQIAPTQDGNSNATFDKLSQLLEALVKGLEQATSADDAAPVSAVT